MNILAIDPGASGGFAWVLGSGVNSVFYTDSMPDGMTAQIDLIRSIVAPTSYWSGETGPMCAFIEKTGTYMPGNSGPASVKFARHCGHLEAALYCLGVPTEQVAPGVWQKHLGALPADKPERKRAIKELMARRYPHLDVTLKVSDALGILTWALETRK